MNDYNDYIYCDTEIALIQSVNILKECNTLIIDCIDCEGHKLRKYGGKVFLITVDSLSPSVHIFDAVALSLTVMHPVFDLPESPSIIKVLYESS